MASSAGGKKKLIAVLGALNWDTTLFVRSFGDPGEEIRVLKVEEGPGGKGGNVAVAVARILGRGKVAFIGAVGRDEAGERLLEGLESEGVNTSGVVALEGESTGHAFIIVDQEGRKTIHTSFGANDSLGPTELRRLASAGSFKRSEVVVIMDVPTPMMVKAAKDSTAAAARVVLSPGVGCSNGISDLRDALALADSLVVNEAELLRLCGVATTEKALRRLRDLFPRLVVVCTQGRKGALVQSQGRSRRVPPFALSGFGLKAVNSTGSGDAFLAAYVAYSLWGADPMKAVGWGNLAGALKSTHKETRGSPPRAELEKYMRLVGST
jgi:ribokinase